MGREELRALGRFVRPVYAYSFFTVSPRSLDYTILYEYEDPYEYYRRVVEDPVLYEEELEMLSENMQEILDEEVTRFNDREIRPEVLLTDIGFRGDYRSPYIVFRVSAEIELRRGRNVYENIYEATTAPYDYASYWYFPRGSRIVEVSIDGVWEVEGESLVVYVKRDTRVSGREKIVFYV